MSRTGVTVKDVAARDFIVTYATYLKRSGKVDVPNWVDIVKTGTFKELAPYDPNWYYIRLAAVARKVYLRNGLGMNKFKTIYGGPNNKGVSPAHFTNASGSVLRSVLKNLEKLKVIEKDPKRGRRITHTGQRDLDKIAERVAAKTRPAPVAVVPAAPAVTPAATDAAATDAAAAPAPAATETPAATSS